MFEEGGKRLGNSFTVIDGDTQEAAIKEAGFEDVNVKVYKVRRLQPCRLISLLHTPGSCWRMDR